MERSLWEYSVVMNESRQILMPRHQSLSVFLRVMLCLRLVPAPEISVQVKIVMSDNNAMIMDFWDLQHPYMVAFWKKYIL